MTEIVSKISSLQKPCVKTEIEIGLNIADKLIDILSERGDGIGLSANQIGLLDSVCVLALPDEESDAIWVRKFINPEITSLKYPVVFKGEGCLSFPGENLTTLRYLECEVVDSLRPKGITLTGIEAICIQHETDHLNGVTMFDRKFNICKPNDRCPCRSGKKFKRCCIKVLMETSKSGEVFRTVSQKEGIENE